MLWIRPLQKQRVRTRSRNRSGARCLPAVHRNQPTWQIRSPGADGQLETVGAAQLGMFEPASAVPGQARTDMLVGNREMSVLVLER